ncbi:hypothetical protein OC845_005041 [Tilletia horrida]|nr:hypothetical protein OC845_005041 [Tilletia horrida]
MSRLDGVIILGADGRPIIQSHFRSSNHALALAHIDFYNHASSSSSSSSSALPLLWVPGVPSASPATHADGGEDDEEVAEGTVVRIGNGKQRELDWQEALADQGAALAHIKHGSLTFLCPVSAEINPMLPLTFLRALLSLLAIYCGGLAQVNEHSIREHFDVVYQILEETLDDGWPLFTEPNALQDLIITQSWLDRVTKVVNATGLTSAPSPQLNELSPIPWRRANVYHRNQEFYADVVDSLEGTLDAPHHSHRPLILDLYTRLSCRSKLSGNPEVSLTLSANASSLLTDAALHPCVRHRKWVKDQIFSFVPPDGPFELANFRVGEPLALPFGSAQDSARRSKSGLLQMPNAGNGWERDVPFLVQSSFEVKPMETRSGGGGSSRHGSQVDFSISIQSRLPGSTAIENIVVSVGLGAGAHSVDAVASGGGTGTSTTTGSGTPTAGQNQPISLSSTQSSSALKTVTDALSTTVAALGTASVGAAANKSGAWVLDQGTRTLKWEIPRLSSGAERPALLKGSFITADSPPRIAAAVRTTFSIPMHSLSNVRVNSVHIAGEGGPGFKVFKGIRNVVEGDLEWRRF